MGVSQRPAEQKAFIADMAARETDRKQALAIRGRGRWLIAGATALAINIGPVLGQSNDVTTAGAGGAGGDPYTLSCPNQMVLIGVKSLAGAYVNAIEGVCSRYDSNGNRLGDPIKTDVNTGGWRDTFTTFHERICPDNRAITRITGRAQEWIDRLFVHCSAVGPDGLSSGTSQNVSAEPIGSSGGGETFDLTCPDRKFARAFSGRAGFLVDRIGLVCNEARLSASRVESVTLRPFAATSGTTVVGTVTLNGYAEPLTNIILFGESITSVRVNPDTSVATFQFLSRPTTAGCFSVSALLVIGTSPASVFPPVKRSNDVVLTPPRPFGARFRFDLVDPPASRTYIAPRSISARISFGSPKQPAIAGADGTVTFASSNPAVVTAPASVSYNRNQTGVNVPLTAMNAGCVIITATRNGVSIRKTIRIVDISG